MSADILSVKCHMDIRRMAVITMSLLLWQDYFTMTVLCSDSQGKFEKNQS